MVKRQNFVTFYSPGTFVSECGSQPCESWDIREAVQRAKKVKERYGATPYGFRFESRIVADPVSDGEGGTLAVQPKTVKESGTHFLGGTLLTLREVEARNQDDERILRSNMRHSPIVCVNTNSYRSTLPFEEGDILLDDKGNIIERGNDPKHVAYRAEVAAMVKAENDEWLRKHAELKKPASV